MTSVMGLLFLVLVPVLAGLMLAFTWLSHMTVRRTIGGKHQALEEIHRYRRVPAWWTKKYDAKLSALLRSGAEAGSSKAAEWNRRKRQRVKIELDRLITYTRRTKLIDEEARSTLLDDLDGVRQQWQ